MQIECTLCTRLRRQIGAHDKREIIMKRALLGGCRVHRPERRTETDCNGTAADRSRSRICSYFDLLRLVVRFVRSLASADLPNCRPLALFCFYTVQTCANLFQQSAFQPAARSKNAPATIKADWPFVRCLIVSIALYRSIERLSSS